MNKVVTIVLFLAGAILLLITPYQVFAQTSDTVIVYASMYGPAISQEINFDQANHPNAHRVYVLQQKGIIDTIYFYVEPIEVNGDITIIGRINPTTKKPPLIQPYILPDATSPPNFITSSGKGTVTLKNLYFLGLRYDGIPATNNLIYINSDSTNVVIDHCVIDNITGNVTNFRGKWDSFYLTNSEIRNNSNSFWNTGDAIMASSNPADTVIMINNSFFCMGNGVCEGKGYFKYFQYEHNTNFLGTGGLFCTTHLTNAIIRNNIFYGVIAHGADTSFIKMKRTNDAGEGFGIVMMDSLKTIETAYGISEAQRNVTVDHNDYYWPGVLKDMWNSVNDTAPGWVIPPQWMNAQTGNMFGDKVNWPGLVSSNIDSVEPGFSQLLVSSAVDSLVKFVKKVGWTKADGSLGSSGTFRWWQLPTNPVPLNGFNQVPVSWKGWQDGYPVPENLKYSGTLIGSDGLPLGDLNWFQNTIPLPEMTKLILPSTDAVDIAANSTLICSKVSGALKYRWQVSTNPAFSNVVVDDITADTMKPVVLTGGSKYYWRVQTLNFYGESNFTGPDSFSVMTPPSAPTLVMPLSDTTFQHTDSLVMIWHPVSEVIGYRLEISGNPFFTSLAASQDSIKDTTYTIIYLNNFKKYYWRVQAYNAGGSGAFAAPDSFKVMAVPEKPILVSPAMNSVGVERRTDLKWSLSTLATKYRFQIATDSTVYAAGDSIGLFFSQNIVFDTTLADTSLQLGTPLMAKTKYYWHVSGIDTVGEGENSSTFAFT